MLKRLVLAIALIFSASTPAISADIFSLNSLNLQGDVLYLINEGEFAVGAGTNIATFFDVAELRAELVTPEDAPVKGGLGIGVNIVKIVSKIGGNWLIETMNPSIGIVVLGNFSGDVELEPAAYISAINWQH